MAQVDMDHEQNHLTHETGYGNNESWMNINNNSYTSPQQHQSPVFENGGYNFMPTSGHHGLPMEPPSFISPRLPSHHQMLQPLVMPSNPTWPSELVSHSAVSYSEPVQVPAPVISAPVVKGNSSKLPNLTAHTPSPRRTLTDDDRRRMCQYHEENPHVKQTEIGAMFGVERSTVSKVLRQKEKYLYPTERTASPAKRVGKGKIIDIDRTLESWIRNQQKLGIDITDSSLAEKARFFASSVGDHALIAKIGSASWVTKFKHKHGVVNGKLTRRASTTNISEMSSRSMARSSSSTVQTPNDMSPTSPILLPSPSPLSGTKSDDDKVEGQSNSYFSFGGGNRYKHSNSHSTTSLSSVFTDTGATLFSAGPTSPTTPFTFSPDQTSAPWHSSQQTRYPLPSNLVRPRSQTFPTLEAGFVSSQSSDSLTPKYNNSSTEPPSTTLDSPMHEMAAPFAINTAISSPSLHRSASNGSMGPPSTTTPLTGIQSTPASSAPSSPATEDLRKALDTILTFIQQTPSSFSDQTQYTTVLNWAMAERSKTQQNAALPILPGGLHQIPEQDYEPSSKPEES